jgi:serine O-acetyltransferase
MRVGPAGESGCGLEACPPSDLSLFATLRRDLARYDECHCRADVRPSRSRVAIESLLFKGGFQAVLLYRLSHWLFEAGSIWLAWLVTRLSLTLTGAEIEFSAQIGPGLHIAHPVGIVIGRGTVIGKDATIYQGVTCGIRSRGAGPARNYPHIGDGVVLFARSSVLGGITVGSYSVIGAHALIVRDVPGGAVARGAEATILDRGDLAARRARLTEAR